MVREVSMALPSGPYLTQCVNSKGSDSCSNRLPSSASQISVDQRIGYDAIAALATAIKRNPSSADSLLRRAAVSDQIDATRTLAEKDFEHGAALAAPARW